MTIHAPQLIYLCIVAMELGLYLAKHGEPKKGTYNFGVGLFANGHMFALLYWGGFFN